MREVRSARDRIERFHVARLRRTACSPKTIPADRDYPPFARSARDGFAVRAADCPANLRVIGEVRAGEVFTGSDRRQAVEIMTGRRCPAARTPSSWSSTSTRREHRVAISRSMNRGENFTPRGTEAKRGEIVLRAGGRLDSPRSALLAMVGRERVAVYPPPARRDSADRR